MPHSCWKKRMRAKRSAAGSSTAKLSGPLRRAAIVFCLALLPMQKTRPAAVADVAEPLRMRRGSIAASMTSSPLLPLPPKRSIGRRILNGRLTELICKRVPQAREKEAYMRQAIDEQGMRLVMRKFPDSKWTQLAAFHLIENKLCGDWQGSSKCPDKEAEMYEKYVKEHPESPAVVEALYDAAWSRA